MKQNQGSHPEVTRCNCGNLLIWGSYACPRERRKIFGNFESSFLSQYLPVFNLVPHGIRIRYDSKIEVGQYKCHRYFHIKCTICQNVLKVEKSNIGILGQMCLLGYIPNDYKLLQLNLLPSHIQSLLILQPEQSEAFSFRYDEPSHEKCREPEIDMVDEDDFNFMFSNTTEHFVGSYDELFPLSFTSLMPSLA